MLDRRTFFIREHVGVLKLSDTYDILDPETKEQLGIAKEDPSTTVLFLRFLINKRTLPTKVFVYEGSDPGDSSKLLFSIERGFTFLRSKVEVYDAKRNLQGWLKSKLLSIGASFDVFDSSGEQIASIKGDLIGWNIRVLDKTGAEIGTVTKKWSGIGKELFTTADNYIVALNERHTAGRAVLLLAAGLALDTIYKE